HPRAGVFQKEFAMGDTVIITEDEPKPAPQVVVEAPKVEKVVTEKTTVTRVRNED
ncbi:MAG: hypothetical protein JWP16_569, partial [Alphaproteobacteria bacterium]|nr:hypothetical protein [Alphaproteobacteria bacterium]